MMKKLVAILVVLAMTATLSAGTLIVSALDNGDGTCTISYSTSDPAPVGMALNVDCTAGQIDAVAVDSFFDIYMDDAYDLESATPGSYTYGAGEPIALQVGPGGDDLPSANFCISMGGLGGETEPLDPAPSSGTIVLTGPDGTAGSITVNAQRGGVIDVEGNAMDVDTLPLAFTISIDVPPDCMKEAGVDVSDPTLYAAFLDAGSPECWCYPNQCYGDADGQLEGDYYSGYYAVGTLDLNIVSAGWQQQVLSGNMACADFDHAKEGDYYSGYYRVGTLDINILSTYWQNATVPPGDCVPGNR